MVLRYRLKKWLVLFRCMVMDKHHYEDLFEYMNRIEGNKSKLDRVYIGKVCKVCRRKWYKPFDSPNCRCIAQIKIKEEK